MESYYDAMRSAVEAHGGTVTQFLGDGVKAVFGPGTPVPVSADKTLALLEEKYLA